MILDTNKHKRQISELQSRVRQLEEESLAQRRQWEDERIVLNDSLQEARRRLTYHTGLFSNEVAFSQTMIELQKTMMLLAASMKDEAKAADLALASTSENTTSLNVVVSNVLEMATKTKAEAETVEVLNQQAVQIGGIVKLIKEVADQTTFWLSTPPSRQLVRANKDADLQLWRTRSENSQSVRLQRRLKLPRWSTQSEMKHPMRSS